MNIKKWKWNAGQRLQFKENNAHKCIVMGAATQFEGIEFGVFYDALIDKNGPKIFINQNDWEPILDLE